jgi:hypothetical protein
MEIRYDHHAVHKGSKFGQIVILAHIYRLAPECNASWWQLPARALRDPLARYMYHNPHLQRPTINRQKSVCQNLSMGKSYEARRIFLQARLLLIFESSFAAISHTFGSKPVHICTSGQLSSKLEYKQEKSKS